MRTLTPPTDEDFPAVNWLFVDLNAYFASVEQQERPELRGKPIGVVPIITENACCIAVSYEAKAYGVNTGFRAQEAQRACPRIQFVESRPKLYVEYHHRIIEAIERSVPISAVVSIDEMACRLIGRERHLANAQKLAAEIKARLREVGDTLRCSIGLAPNRYLAKVASDMQKPDGLVALLSRDLPQALYPLTPSDLPGVGYRMEKRLLMRGIKTMQQLCALSPAEMRNLWGSVIGERVWHWMRGADFEHPTSDRKSIGRQHVLAPQYRTREKAYGVALKLLHRAAENMRQLNLWASGIGVAVRFMKKRLTPGDSEQIFVPPFWEAYRRIPPSCDSFALQHHLNELWQSCPAHQPLQVSIWLFGLVADKDHSLSLFSDDSGKRRRASLVMDRLNLKYGQQTVYLGGIHGARESAPRVYHSEAFRD